MLPHSQHLNGCGSFILHFDKRLSMALGFGFFFFGPKNERALLYCRDGFLHFFLEPGGITSGPNNRSV